MNLWSPWIDPVRGLRGVDPERYALRAASGMEYYSLDPQGQIVTVAGADGAYQFHTHEKAVTTARAMAAVLERPVDVVKVL